MTTDMTKGNVLRHILRFAVPTCFGMAFQQLYSLIDTMIVGKVLGVNQLAGVGATSSLFFIVIYFCIGICSGFSIPVASAFGSGNESEVRRYTANGTWLCVGSGIILTTVVCLLCRQMLIWLNTPEEIFSYAYIYIKIVFLGIPCTLLYNFVACIVKALGDSKTPLAFLAFSSVLNIVLDLLFLIPLGMDVEGAALATVISQGVSGLICLFTIRKNFPILKFQKGDWRFRASYAKKLGAVGYPMGLQYSITGIGSLVVSWAVNGLGTTAVAGVTAAMKINYLITCPIEALGQTMAPYTGQNVGAGKLERIGDGLRKASFSGFIWAALCIPLIWFFGRPLSALFLDEYSAEVIEYSFRYLMTTACGYCLLTLVNTVRFSIQGMGFSGFAMTSGVLEMLARSIAGGMITPLFGFAGICVSNVLAWIFADIFLLPAYLRCRNKLRHRSGGDGTPPAGSEPKYRRRLAG